MKEKPKGDKVTKELEDEQDTGDFGTNDAEIFKYLPDPKDLLKQGTKGTRGRTKKVRR